jgi:hypothetical protein
LHSDYGFRRDQAIRQAWNLFSRASLLSWKKEDAMVQSLSSRSLALLLSLPLVGSGVLSAGDGERKTETGVAPAIAVWDTGKQSEKPITPDALAARDGWTQVPVNETLDSFKGDAVVSNGRITLVVRKGVAALEIHSTGAARPAERCRLLLLDANGDPATNLKHAKLVENAKGAASLEVSYQTAKQAEVVAKFRIKRGEVSLEAQPSAGAGRLRVECPSRFVALPDFFADDIVADARKIAQSAIEVPSDNFLLHLQGKGEAIAMCVFENRQHDVKLTLSGEGKARTITGSEIGFEGKKIWVALLEGPQVWHTRELTIDDTGKMVLLEWKMPFVAQWRVDFTRTNGLTDSWEMLLQKEKDGGYVKPSWLGGGDQDLNAKRERWNTVLGDFLFPCWSDRERRGYLQPLKSEALQFAGPVIVYPINRVKETPLDAFTVVDVMRGTLGVGPCEHILDVEGQKAEYKGRATCSVRDTLGEIYTKKQQKEKHDEIEKILDDGLIFVKHIRGRITRYVEFGQKMRAYLAEQKKAHPDLSDSLAELDKIVREIDTRVAARVDKIQTPEYVARINDAFRKNVLDYEGEEALQRCQKYGEALVVVGDNQDELSAECRWVVKTLRQRAGLLVASDPKLAPVAAEIRARTQEALRNPANHEGARH